jgi:hypothetical protein
LKIPHLKIISSNMGANITTDKNTKNLLELASSSLYDEGSSITDLATTVVHADRRMVKNNF